jgi:hypothetical protein
MTIEKSRQKEISEKRWYWKQHLDDWRPVVGARLRNAGSMV